MHVGAENHWINRLVQVVALLAQLATGTLPLDESAFTVKPRECPNCCCKVTSGKIDIVSEV